MSLFRRSGHIVNQESFLKKLLMALLLLNLGDMLFTIWGVETGTFVEANPLLRWCMSRGHLFFVLIKTGLCIQFVLGSLVVAKKVKYYAVMTSIVVLIYSAVVLRTVGLLF